MKVFISWSGDESKKIALILRDWLPSVIQSLKPYVSSEDIDKGARWSSDVATELQDTSFGILCVTKSNFRAPWILFEAGALSKVINKSFVCPFLFDIKRAEIDGPLLIFQSTIFEKEDVRKLLFSVNKSLGEFSLKEELLNKTYEVWWPNLEESLNKIKDEISDEIGEKEIKDEKLKILEEILELSRTNQKLLRSPENLLPLEYFRNALIEFLERTSDIEAYDRQVLENIKDLAKRFLEYTETFALKHKIYDQDFNQTCRGLYYNIANAINHLINPKSRMIIPTYNNPPKSIMEQLDQMNKILEKSKE